MHGVCVASPAQRAGIRMLPPCGAPALRLPLHSACAPSERTSAQVSFANLQVFCAALARLVRHGKGDAQLQERLKAAAEALCHSFRELAQAITNPAADGTVLDAFLVKAMAANFEGRLQSVTAAVRSVRHRATVEPNPGSHSTTLRFVKAHPRRACLLSRLIAKMSHSVLPYDVSRISRIRGTRDAAKPTRAGAPSALPPAGCAPGALACAPHGPRRLQRA